MKLIIRRPIRDEDLAPFAEFEQPRIYSLHLYKARLTGNGLDYLSKQSSLADLSLRGHFTDEALEPLSRWTGLTMLSLSCRELSDAGLRHLAHHPSLHTLTIYRDKITDRGLEPLATIPQLRHLKLVGTDVSRAGIRRLQERAPNLTIMCEPDPTERDLLRLGFKVKTTEQHLPGLDWPPQEPQVIAVSFPYAEAVNEQQLEPLYGVLSLREIELSETDFQKDGFTSLWELPELTSITIGLAARDESLVGLNRLPALRQLDLRGPLTDAGLAKLAELRHLEVLQFRQTSITDAGLLAHAPRFTSLQKLHLEGANFTEEGVRRLRENCPKLGITYDPSNSLLRRGKN